MSAPTADPVRLAGARARLAEHGVDVLYEDHLLLGIAKSAGVLSQRGPAGEASLVERIDRYRRDAEGKAGRAFVGLVHRLDRNVSGAMVVAKTSKAASRLSNAFREHEGVEKTYLAWVAGEPEADRATLTSVLVRDYVRRVTRVEETPSPRAAKDAPDEDDAGGVATLAYEVDARGKGCARLVVHLRTGATHQIRAQLAREGLPLVGDAKYGGPPAPASARCDRPALHARRLVVPHPTSGEPVRIGAPVPDDLRRLDRALGLASAR